MNETKTVNLHLPLELHEKIKQMATETGRSFHKMALLMLDLQSIEYFELKDGENE